MKFVFNFPDLGEGLEEGTILEWFVSEGAKVKVGDSIVQMETDKVVADIPSPRNGTIVALYGSVGDVIHVGTRLVEIETDEGELSEEGKLSHEGELSDEGVAVVGTMELAGNDGLLEASSEGTLNAENRQLESQKSLATPVARALAKEMGIDINQVPGSGPSGRVKKDDILNYAPHTAKNEGRDAGVNDSTSATFKEGSHQHYTDNQEEVTYKPLTQIRKTIAKNMLHSKHNAAHMSIFEEVEISTLKQVVAGYKSKFAEKGVKLTYLAFVVKAVAQALKHHPQLNSQIDMDNNRMIFRNRFHIAFAVDAPDGLVVPVIRDADRLSIFDIARKIEELATKARDRKLVLDEMKEGSFTITSFGSIGGIFATPVINYPQAGILGIGRILKTPIVKGDEIVVGNIMPLSVSVDHRIVDGGEATRFVKKIMDYLADPISLLMDA